MITGDSKETAIAIATELGFYDAESTAISCHDLDAYTEKQLSDRLDHVAVFYRMSPSHKMKIVEAFRLKGRVVAMTGYCIVRTQYTNCIL
jgi:Ca2+-transporting ATPase